MGWWEINEAKGNIDNIVVYYRSQALKLYVVARSNGICEGCGDPAPFNTKNGPFLECHHVHRLADGGPDDPKNVVALCPNCHRRAHFSQDAEEYNNLLKVLANEAEKNAL
ncbi:HNH endonuclease [Gynuella sunshinyii]|uniref:HNH endonuclease n=1 Tax=Gynuella sunshinyii TaxID=1445505 RepID=UPI0005CBCD5D|nr:HNH endonuclease signature motif containing protein [Gynuella sunshinyii]